MQLLFNVLFNSSITFNANDEDEAMNITAGARMDSLNNSDKSTSDIQVKVGIRPHKPFYIFIFVCICLHILCRNGIVDRNLNANNHEVFFINFVCTVNKCLANVCCI